MSLLSTQEFHLQESIQKYMYSFTGALFARRGFFFKGMRGGFYVAINRRAAIERSMIPEVKKGKLRSVIHNMTLKFHMHMFMCVKKISGKIQK